MRILIVKLSSMGDVIHALPVVQDVRRVHPDAIIDWAVEPGFAPLVQRCHGISNVIEVPLRRWTRTWWHASTRGGFMALRRRLRQHRYDAVLDLQGLTKSALIAAMARGHRYALANRTDGSGYEAPTRWVADTAIAVEPHVHALDRSRIMAAKALGYAVTGPPDFGLRASAATAREDIIAFLHGTSRDDKLWPEADWVALGADLIGKGWRIALAQGSPAEGDRARRIAGRLGPKALVWPNMPLGELMDVLGSCRGAIGVDSGLSHLAVALDLPHVQIYNFPTAWRTGPLTEHGHHHQMAVEASPTPSFSMVASAWTTVAPVRKDTHKHAQAISRNDDFADDEEHAPTDLRVGHLPPPSVS